MKRINGLIFKYRAMFPIASEVVIGECSSQYNRVASFFSWQEIETNRVLQYFFYAVCLGFFITFYSWTGSPAVTIDLANAGQHICPPYFQSCGQWYFLRKLPDGTSQGVFYTFLLVFLVLAIGFSILRQWVWAMTMLIPLYLWKVLAIFVLSYQLRGNYHYFHLYLTTVFLFFPFKLFFLRRTLVLLYFLTGILKIQEGWIIGSIFTSTVHGIPFLSESIVPIMTKGVIFLEIVLSWGLLSSKIRYQKSVLLLYVLFHFYSVGIVGYMFPTLVLPPLLILFLPRVKKASPPVGVLSYPGWLLLSLLIFLQAIDGVISSEPKITQEGRFYGLNMADANHQCRSSTSYIYKNGKIDSYVHDSANGRNRCEVYTVWFRLQHYCQKLSQHLKQINWRLDYSINGGPFYRIVDVPDACSLVYDPFGRNSWITTPEKGAVIIARPVKNGYY